MSRLRLNPSSFASYALVLLSGAALSLAYPEAGVGPLAWLAIAPLLIAAQRAPARRGLALGLTFGVGFFGVLLAWISYVGWIAWILLVALQAAFLGIFSISWAVASRLDARAARVVLASVLWVAVEFLRSVWPLGGFTWGQLAQSQHDLSWMLKAASLGGGWTIAFVVVLCNAAIAEAWSGWREGARRAVPVLAVAAIVVVAAPALVPGRSGKGTPVRVAIVQGNIPQRFEGSTYEKDLVILDSHQKLTEGLRAQDPDLVIWPESSIGMDANDPIAMGAIRAAARTVGAPMIVGGNLDAGTNNYKVMAFLVSSKGKVIKEYQKTHLVPFGEYVPVRNLLGFVPMLDQVPRDAIPSDVPKVFEAAGGTVAPVISYEGDFGPLVRERIDLGGRLLVVATNTSTWGYSSASAQHVAFSQVRAAENGVWVAHASLTGISAFIAPDGEIAASTPLWTATTLVREVNFTQEVTLYARTGDWLPWGCIALSIAGLIVSVTRRMPRPVAVGHA